MTFLTDFADPAVILPLALVAAVMLALTGWSRIAGTPPPRLPLPRLLGPALVAVIVMHGYHLHAEAALHTLAARYAWLAPFCTAHGSR